MCNFTNLYVYAEVAVRQVVCLPEKMDRNEEYQGDDTIIERAIEYLLSR
jgi:hypothetical protein